jgi:Zn-finger nucleic acid-binding protein
MLVACPRCQLTLDTGERPPGSTLRCRCTAVITVPAPPSTAGFLRCPSCGGSVEDSSLVSCGYCNAALATLLCPTCMATNFCGARCCVRCGATLPIAGAAQATGLACPRCPGGLTRELLGDTAVEACRACGGAFVERETFERLVQDHEERQRVLSQTPVSVAEREKAVRYLRCPHCREVMNRKVFGRRSGIIIDVCRSHGTWFDRDELPRALEFVEGGGLLAALVEEKEALSNEVRRLQRERHGAGSAMSVDLGSPQLKANAASAVARFLLDFFT